MHALARVALLVAHAATGHASGKLYVAGSGLNMFSQPETIDEVIKLAGKSKPRVLYLGTATYDDPGPMDEQTKGFIAHGCSVSSLQVAWLTPPATVLQQAFETTDIVLISGGNTLFAVDRWVKTGIDKLMAQALSQGVVLSGGSAGFISLCNGGHSDSMEPDSYKNPPGPLLNSSNAARAAVDSNWAYIRVPGVGVLNTLCCPHYDMTGSNGVPRERDFTTMLQHHAGEAAIGIDNWAALVIDGEDYHVIARAGHAGSVGPAGEFAPNRTGTPGMWQLHIDTAAGTLNRTLVPAAGKVAALLTPPRYIIPSTQLAVARGQNPDDGLPAEWNVTALSRRPNGYVRSNPGWWH